MALLDGVVEVLGDLLTALGVDNPRIIDRLFGRIKRFRRVFTRYDKTDLWFRVIVTVAFIADRLR